MALSPWRNQNDGEPYAARVSLLCVQYLAGGYVQSCLAIPLSADGCLLHEFCRGLANMMGLEVDAIRDFGFANFEQQMACILCEMAVRFSVWLISSRPAHLASAAYREHTQ